MNENVPPQKGRGLIDQDWDLSSLTRGPLKFGEAKQVLTRSVKTSLMSWKGRGVAAFVVFIAVAVLAKLLSGQGATISVGSDSTGYEFVPSGNMLPTVAFLVVAVAIGLLALARRMRITQVMPVFAAANNVTWTANAPEFSLPIPEFAEGWGHSTSDLVQSIEGPQVSILNHQYKVGSGKQQRTYLQAVIAVDLGVDVPPVSIVPHQALPWASYAGLAPLKLGAGVDNHFDAYVEAGSQQDALYFLTPDVLAALIDNVPGRRVYLVGRQLILVEPGMTFNVADANIWEGIVRILKTVGSQFLEQAAHASTGRSPLVSPSEGQPDAIVRGDALSPGAVGGTTVARMSVIIAVTLGFIAVFGLAVFLVGRYMSSSF